MAYKFQRGSATLSGSLTAEDGLAGTLGVADLDIDGATDIGEDLADADLLVVDNGAGGTNAYSDGTAKVVIDTGWDAVTRPPTFAVNFIIRGDY